MDPPILSKAFWFTLAATFAARNSSSVVIGVASVTLSSATDDAPRSWE